jgi:hypothetical protein
VDGFDPQLHRHQSLLPQPPFQHHFFPYIPQIRAVARPAARGGASVRDVVGAGVSGGGLDH